MVSRQNLVNPRPHPLGKLCPRDIQHGFAIDLIARNTKSLFIGSVVKAKPLLDIDTGNQRLHCINELAQLQFAGPKCVADSVDFGRASPRTAIACKPPNFINNRRATDPFVVGHAATVNPHNFKVAKLFALIHVHIQEFPARLACEIATLIAPPTLCVFRQFG